MSRLLAYWRSGESFCGARGQTRLGSSEERSTPPEGVGCRKAASSCGARNTQRRPTPCRSVTACSAYGLRTLAVCCLILLYDFHLRVCMEVVIRFKLLCVLGWFAERSWLEPGCVQDTCWGRGACNVGCTACGHQWELQPLRGWCSVLYMSSILRLYTLHPLFPLLQTSFSPFLTWENLLLTSR